MYQEVELYPKTKTELFNEYSDKISIHTFRSWMKTLADEGKIRKNTKVLTTKEVKTVYEEFGIPGRIVPVSV